MSARRARRRPPLLRPRTVTVWNGDYPAQFVQAPLLTVRDVARTAGLLLWFGMFALLIAGALVWAAFWALLAIYPPALLIAVGF